MSLADEPGMHSKWNAYARKTGLNGGDFSALMGIIGKFLARPYHAACSAEHMSGRWHAETLQWQ